MAPMLYFDQDSKVVEHPAYWVDSVPILRVLRDGEILLPGNVMCLLNKSLGLTRKMMSSWPQTGVSYDPNLYSVQATKHTEGENE